MDVADGVLGQVTAIHFREYMDVFRIACWQADAGVVILDVGHRPVAYHAKDVRFINAKREPVCPCCGRAYEPDPVLLDPLPELPPTGVAAAIEFTSTTS
jgi:hypothetical protein